EGLSFLESVEALAHQAGLQMPQNDPKSAEKERRQASLIDVTQAAARWFGEQLAKSTAAQARSYLEKRGVSDALAREFGLGFAPGARRGLVKYLQARDVTIDMIVEAGLAIKPDDGGVPYDRFRDRIIFPIQDARGRVIAFGGRAMQADARAKYLNSPETPLFHKSSVLFNFARARQPAYDTKSVLVAEGYMDVIGLARAGIDHAVAPLGTAITEEQIRLLWRLAPEPIMCLDGDQAGLRAAYRAIDRALPLLTAGYSLRFAMLPAGKDPDDLVAEGGAEVVQNVIGRALSMIDLLWEREVETAPWNTPERAAALKKRLRAAVRQINDADVRALYAQEIKTRLDRLLSVQGVPYRATGERSWPTNRQSWRHQSAKSETRRSTIAQGNGMPPREALIVLCVINHPDLMQKHRDLFETLIFETAGLDKLRFHIIDYADRQIDPAEGLDNGGLTGHLDALGESALVEQLRQMPEALTMGFVRQDSALEIV
ncbi:MAG: DNA primase, partial [Pseudomonadota bacterium]|nr:DNA primase [Pseudomonadota bacterium]